MSEIQYTCPSCGGTVSFDPKEEKLHCPFCGQTQAIEDLNKPLVQEELDLEAFLDRFDDAPTEELHLVHCPACGGETSFGANIESGACDFCGTALVVSGETQKALKPQYVLPFKIASSDAENYFKNWLKKRWFAPNTLSRLARVEEALKGIYYPYWTYDAQTNTWYQGLRGDNYTVQVQSKDSEGNTVTRTETRIRWSPRIGDVERFFDDLLVPGSASLPEKLSSQLQDWNLEDLVDYNPAVLSGFKSESYSVNLREGFEKAKKKMDAQIQQDIRKDIGGDHQKITQFKVQYSELSFKYIQLPLWTLLYKFGKKYYRVIINGQNGKMSGERPYSVLKILFFSLAILALGTAAYFLINYLNQGS